MKINPAGFPLPLSKELITILNQELDQVSVNPQAGVTVNFRDPNYSEMSGGFHPVEISVAADGRILFVTDFRYVGMPPFTELAKELNFDAVVDAFQH